jgi:hypothetical protein
MKAATLALFCLVPAALVAAESGNPNADHQEMLARLKITAPLRPGPAGRLNADGTAPANYANYDEGKATAKSPVPPLLVMKNGRRITTPAQWQKHRAELLEIFDREFYGRVPNAAKNIKVTWEITPTTQGMSGNMAAAGASPVWKLLGRKPLSNTALGLGFDDPALFQGIWNPLAAGTTPGSLTGNGGGPTIVPRIAQRLHNPTASNPCHYASIAAPC